MTVSDIDKLRVLLPHWQEHNAAHADEYRTWAERARAAGEPHVAEHLATAVVKLESINRELMSALVHIGGAATAGEYDLTPSQHHHHDHTHDHHGHDHDHRH